MRNRLANASRRVYPGGSAFACAQRSIRRFDLIHSDSRWCAAFHWSGNDARSGYRRDKPGGSLTRCALWLALALCTATSAALADDRDFAFSREVKVPPLKQQDLVSIRLDSDVFAATQERLADVRLFDAEGKQVPFLLRKRQTTRPSRTRTTWIAQHVSAKPLGDGGLEITMERDEDDKHPQPNGLSLITPLRNFEQRVRVYTSDFGKDWRSAGDEAVIFDYSRYMDVRSDSVPFPETARRHFRIVVDDVTAEQQSQLVALTRKLQGADETERTEQVVVDRRPFRIDRVEFWREAESDQATGDEKTSYPVSKHRVERDRKEKQTVVSIDVERQPLTSLQLETPDRVFSRHAVVEAEKTQGVRRTWEKIGEATLSRVDFKNLKREQLSIPFPESRHSQFRLVIDDRDSPPLEVAGIKAEGNVYEIVYLAVPEQNYQLVYGSSDAEPAAYDTSALQELLHEKFQPAQAGLGAQAPWKGQGPAEIKWSKLANNPFLLGGIIALLVVVLGWGLYRAMRRMEKLPSE
jgi:hypothetical protein